MENEIDKMNRWLRTHGGVSVCGRSNYRIVWSSDCFEKRLGTFTDYDSTGTIFLKTVTEVRLAPKYTYIQDRWILEKFFDANYGENAEGDGYEPIYPFMDKDGNFLSPTYKVLERLIWMIKNPARIKNWKERVDDLKAKEQKDIDKAVELMDFDETTVAYKLGERVSMAGTEKDKNESTIN